MLIVTTLKGQTSKEVKYVKDLPKGTTFKLKNEVIISPYKSKSILCNNEHNKVYFEGVMWEEKSNIRRLASGKVISTKSSGNTFNVTPDMDVMINYEKVKFTGFATAFMTDIEAMNSVHIIYEKTNLTVEEFVSSCPNIEINVVIEDL